jgi:Sec-independent protein translocase protein TatA
MNIGWQGLVIIAVVLLVVFGVTRLPDLVRSWHKAQSDYRAHLHRSGPAREHPEDVDRSASR